MGDVGMQEVVIKSVMAPFNIMTDLSYSSMPYSVSQGILSNGIQFDTMFQIKASIV